VPRQETEGDVGDDHDKGELDDAQADRPGRTQGSLSPDESHREARRQGEATAKGRDQGDEPLADRPDEVDCVGSAGMGQTGLLVKLGDGNKHCEWIYRFWANPGRPWGGIVPPAPVLAPGSALGSRPRVALSSAQAPSM
jgi:hypothetical protein